jgi:hypothetical protein
MTNFFEILQADKTKFFISKIAKIYSQASIKDVQATGEAFSPKKRTSSISRNEISSGSGSSRPKSIRIRNKGYPVGLVFSPNMTNSRTEFF